jgi:hypothetical protein
MEWTNWQSIKQVLSYRGPAQYELRVVNQESQPFPIPRMLGTDNNGVLVIGQTKNMEKRRRQVITGIEECYGHSECNLFILHPQPLPLPWSRAQCGAGQLVS